MVETRRSEVQDYNDYLEAGIGGVFQVSQHRNCLHGQPDAIFSIFSKSSQTFAELSSKKSNTWKLIKQNCCILVLSLASFNDI